MDFDILGIVRSVAPMLATALGGPLAGAGVSALSNALVGKPDGTEDELASLLKTASPETLVKIKDAEAKFKVTMRELDIKEDDLHAKDRNSARAREMELRDWAPSMIALACFVGFFGILGSMMLWEMPERSVQPINIMLGVLGGIISSITAYYFGSSKSGDSTHAKLSSK